MDFITKWPTEFMVITQGFGNNPTYYGKFGLPGHEGLDFRTRFGKVFSTSTGVISYVGMPTATDAYGYQVHIDVELEGTKYILYFAHMKAGTCPFKIGDKVLAGDYIGMSGMTGNTAANHLHFTLKKVGATKNKETNYPNDQIDPTPYFKDFKYDTL